MEMMETHGRDQKRGAGVGDGARTLVPGTRPRGIPVQKITLALWQRLVRSLKIVVMTCGDHGLRVTEAPKKTGATQRQDDSRKCRHMR